MFKEAKQAHTAEFRGAAVQRVEDGQGVGMAARELGVSEQTLRNWVKAERAGKLSRSRRDGGHARADGALAVTRREQAPANGA
jgi:transposase